MKQLPFLPGPLERCPGCDAPHPEAVSTGLETNFWCRSCGRCWHVELGWLWPVNPASCHRPVRKAADSTSVPTPAHSSSTRSA